MKSTNKDVSKTPKAGHSPSESGKSKMAKEKDKTPLKTSMKETKDGRKTPDKKGSDQPAANPPGKEKKDSDKAAARAARERRDSEKALAKEEARSMLENADEAQKRKGQFIMFI